MPLKAYCTQQGMQFCMSYEADSTEQNRNSCVIQDHTMWLGSLTWSHFEQSPLQANVCDVPAVCFHSELHKPIQHRWSQGHKLSLDGTHSFGIQFPAALRGKFGLHHSSGTSVWMSHCSTQRRREGVVQWFQCSTNIPGEAPDWHNAKILVEPILPLPHPYHHLQAAPTVEQFHQTH